MEKGKIISNLYKLRKFVGSIPGETLNINLDVDYNREERKIINKLESNFSKLKLESNNRVQSILGLYEENELESLDIILKHYDASDSKYIIFGIMLGIVDYNIANSDEEEQELAFKIRNNVSKYYQLLKLSDKNNITVLDSVVMNYPSTSRLFGNYPELQERGMVFIKNYTEGYQKGNDVNLVRVYKVFENLMNKLYNIEMENCKTYKKLNIKEPF